MINMGPYWFGYEPERGSKSEQCSCARQTVWHTQINGGTQSMFQIRVNDTERDERDTSTRANEPIEAG
jgi:hypothetical protein